MGIWQWLLIALFGAELLLSANAHGKPYKMPTKNFWNTFWFLAIVIWFLIKGGFFS